MKTETAEKDAACAAAVKRTPAKTCTELAQILDDNFFTIKIAGLAVAAIQAERCMRRLCRVGHECRDIGWRKRVVAVRELVRLSAGRYYGDGFARFRTSVVRYCLSAAIEEKGEHRKWQDYVAVVEAFRAKEGREG